MTTTCTGSYSAASYVEMEGDTITVPRCNGCGEQFVIIRGRGYPSTGTYPRTMTAEECVREAFKERTLDTMRRR